MSDLITTIRQKYSDITLDRARHLYFSGVSPTDISESLDIDIEDLGYLCFGPNRKGTLSTCWYAEKKTRPELSVHTYQVVKPTIMKQSEMRLMEVINRSTDHLIESDEILDLDDMSKAMGMVEKIDKITRLEENKATENIEVHQSFTLRDILEQLEGDENGESI